MNRLLEEYQKLNSTQLMFIAGITLIILILLVIILRMLSKRRMAKKVNALEVTLTSYVSLPIEFRLNRIQALAAANSEFKEVFSRYSADYSELKSFYDNEIREPMAELDDAVYYKKLRKAKGLLKKLKVVIKEYGTHAHLLLASLEEVSEVESIQRVEIIRIKEQYRVVKQIYDQNKERLVQVEYSIDDYFRQIDLVFAQFEKSMQQNNFDEARVQAESLEASIAFIENAITVLPDMIVKTRQFIPKRVDAVISLYQEMKEEGFWLVPYDVISKVEIINQDFKKILSDINALEIEGASRDIDRIHNQLDALISVLEEERKEKETFMSLKDPLFTRVENLLQEYKRCMRDLKEIQGYYYISDDMKRIINFEPAAKAIQAKRDMALQIIESNKFTMLDMNADLLELQDSLTILEVQVQAYTIKSEELRMDERRVREEIRNLRIVLIEIKSQIRTRQLPIIDESYKTYIENAYHSIGIVEDLLKKRPLPLEELNIRVNDARDIIYKLYDNVHNLIVTAEMVEKAIVFGNRYRSLSPEVESELTKAELFFRNGEYTKALTISIDVMEHIQPGSYEKLLSIKDKR